MTTPAKVTYMAVDRKAGMSTRELHYYLSEIVAEHPTLEDLRVVVNLSGSIKEIRACAPRKTKK